MKKHMTVDDLLPGGCGIIRRIDADGNIRQRLMDMGIIEGVEVEMIRPAPFGDPIQIKVMDTHLALRRNEARTLVIELLGERPHAPRHRHRHRFGRKSKQR